MRYRLAYLLAIWFGCGRFPKMPGTAGTLGAIPLYLLLAQGGPLAVAAGAAIVTLVGAWAATEVVRKTGLKDPQIVCIDEVAGVLITLVAAPNNWKGLLVGVVLFRIFDQWKPWPARQAEKLSEGWGVVMDDVFAGVWGAAVLLLGRALHWL
jgi:Phosphatidylglycerophosphatase A and related proteins